MVIAVSDVRQVATVGEPIPAPPTVEVVDSSGRPVAGVPVSFTVIAGSGVAKGARKRTTALGRATVDEWTIAPEPGDYTLRAEVAQLPATLFTAIGLPPEVAGTSAARSCPIPASVIPAFALGRTAAALRAGRPVTIVALGSSSTSGVGATTPDRAYPAQLGAKLAVAFPASPATVLNEGLGGELASDMVLRLERDVFAHAPDLVIWQTGTNDAGRDVTLEAFTSTLDSGVRQIRDRGVDVLLLDSQRYPGAGEGERARSFQQAMADVAARHGVSILPRYAWMTELVESGTYTYDQLLAPDRFHTSDLMYECIAQYVVVGLAIETYVHPSPAQAYR
jgi:lysophospholipase L1-like esterase